jgi:hypothetical protein
LSKFSIAFLTDAPPLAGDAHGNHILGSNILNALQDAVPLVVTHRFRRFLNKARIRSACRCEVYFYPDSAAFGIRKFLPGVADLLNLLLFLCTIQRTKKRILNSGATKIFVLCGADGWFLTHVWIISKTIFLPLEIYLVDDLEESARLGSKKWLRRMIPRLERAVLQRASKVWVISKGYIHHLQQKYGQRSEWLPLALGDVAEVAHVPFVPDSGGVRPVIFVGALNMLYRDALADLYDEISAWNQKPEAPFQLQLQIVTYGSPAAFIASLPDQRYVDFTIGAPEALLREKVRNSWAVFLPYSFREEMKVMVSTSFSLKFKDALTSGRPVLVYGPEYASIPQYFREENLPLCATHRGELGRMLMEIDEADSPELIRRYSQLLQRNHSAGAIRSRLCNG